MKKHGKCIQPAEKTGAPSVTKQARAKGKMAKLCSKHILIIFLLAFYQSLVPALTRPPPKHVENPFQTPSNQVQGDDDLKGDEQSPTQLILTVRKNEKTQPGRVQKRVEASSKRVPSNSKWDIPRFAKGPKKGQVLNMFEISL